MGGGCGGFGCGGGFGWMSAVAADNEPRIDAPNVANATGTGRASSTGVCNVVLGRFSGLTICGMPFGSGVNFCFGLAMP
jgi:hypothetical protein